MTGVRSETETYHGTPCRAAAHTLRYVSSNCCVECTKVPGRKTYGETYAGKPCRHGHSGLRYVNGRGCVGCCSSRARRDEDFIDEARSRADILRATAAERYREKSLRKYREDQAYSESLRAMGREAYQNRTPEQIKRDDEARRRRYASDPSVKIAATQRRRSSKAGAEGYHSGAHLRAILSMQGGRCVYCDATDRLTLDHVIPLSRGGSNWPWNLQYLCISHNSSKGTRTDAEYRVDCGLPPEQPISTQIWFAILNVT